VVHVSVETPVDLDDQQRSLLAQLASMRGEEKPAGQFAAGQQGFFSRLKDAFNGR
jgi:molecular chaperone DnaJ